ncbi:pirin family protein [Flavisolibacter ginsenosidimutans]|uniref:Pirin family protein n=1 Tax=Flavisolibacter ginsenosidimutans TaxID=661481 RepID=A0A5B8UE52_9BACT|nr:pirin family protein [Flavisolibacter ginsenosidimutans]QEC54961.1 pirin family protein [Flavisolibacter ginsenosidimutans]
MKYRTVKKYTSLQHMNVGPFKIKQPLPNDELQQVSPFLLLHHGGPQTHAPGELKARLSPHPHRGFEPVTFLFSGKIHHKDSTGSEGFLQTGDVQWMTAGSGIIHSEGPSAAFAKEGGEMELVQLWVNLPREQKMVAPKYQDMKKENIPVVKEKGFQLSLVAGEYKGLKGPASTFTPILAMMLRFEDEGETDIQIPSSYNSLLYVLDGEIETGNVLFEKYNLGVFEKNGDGVLLKAKKGGKALLLAGEPINEPVASYGPFVMNYPGEIKQAIMDYELGKMGVLES